VISVFVFYDVNILHPKTIARAQHGTGIVWLKNIFQHHGNMPRPFLNYPVE
jgi:hypothetical protein